MITEPTKVTLKKYGLNIGEWRMMLDEQGGVCAICGREPSSGRMHIDHVHTRGWKKMRPEQRKKFVRGLCCQFCNRFYMSRNMTIQKSRNITLYLLRYEQRKPT